MRLHLPRIARAGWAPAAFLILSVALGLFLNTASARAGGGTAYWQVVLHYSSKGLTVSDAAPMPQMQKAVVSPGLIGAPLRIQGAASWKDERGRSLAEAPIDIPLGARRTPPADLALEEPLAEEWIPEEGYVVLRIPGPGPGSAPRTLSFRRETFAGRMASAANSVLPGAFDPAAWTVALPLAPQGPQPAPGPRAATKIHDAGPDSNRLVIAVLGDGYTASQLDSGLFTQNANTLVQAFLNESPWSAYQNAVNIYRIDVESNQAGADEPPNNLYVDTYFNSKYWFDGTTERLLYVDSTGQNRAISAANQYVGTGVWDYLIILVNATRYGGGGGYLAVASMNSYAPKLIMHEFGHSFAGLADEYETGGTAPPTSDSETNVDFQYDRPNLKWAAWVEAGTPLPTPETTTYASVIGAFLGAKYYATGIYRPAYDCLMRSIGQTFCSVCKETHVVALCSRIQLADSTTPAAGTTVTLSPAGETFSVTPVNLSSFTYTWKLNGNAIPDATGSSILLRNLEIPASISTLQLVLSHPTTYVRKTSITQTYSWLVQRSAASAQPQWELY